MGHVVLLGDSIFDNAAYVGGGPDVVRQLRAVLPSDWRATLNALDGAVTGESARNCSAAPPTPATRAERGRQRRAAGGRGFSMSAHGYRSARQACWRARAILARVRV